jgi:hypothetical protein
LVNKYNFNISVAIIDVAVIMDEKYTARDNILGNSVK